jgi:nucleoside-triphosphate--adenylate kinase
MTFSLISEFGAWLGFRKQGYPLNLVVNLDVSDEVIVSRISDRWVHLPSGRVYNLSYNRPRVDGLDDETGEPLTKRPDDNPVRHRVVT